ncbi:MAG: hypothetical protein HOV81_34355 [Kofleriaceae bacterium]|nr:hypothetical protein [Kofleriaceae bacterium]
MMSRVMARLPPTDTFERRKWVDGVDTPKEKIRQGTAAVVGREADGC